VPLRSRHDPGHPDRSAPSGGRMTAPAPELAVETPDTEGPEVGEVVTEDLLVEDVSIDGMCGVY
jgi:mycofactocin precursor